jgi:hypothetical protein
MNDDELCTLVGLIRQEQRRILDTISEINACLAHGYSDVITEALTNHRAHLDAQAHTLETLAEKLNTQIHELRTLASEPA